MNYILNINDVDLEIQAEAGEKLLNVLRRMEFLASKHGCESGECGACAVLLDGKPVNSCVLLAAQAEGHKIQTIEQMGEHPAAGLESQPGSAPLAAGFRGERGDPMRVLHAGPGTWLLRSYSSATPTPAKMRCAQAFRAYCAAAPVISSRCRLSCVLRRCCAARQVDPIGASDLEP